MPRIQKDTTVPVDGGFGERQLPDPPQSPSGSPGAVPQSSPLDNDLPTTVSHEEIRARNDGLWNSNKGP
jgi:hypothetical protein